MSGDDAASRDGQGGAFAFPGGGPAPWPELSLRNLGVGTFDQTPRH